MPKLTEEETKWLRDELTKEATFLWENIKPVFNTTSWYIDDRIRDIKELETIMHILRKLVIGIDK